MPEQHSDVELTEMVELVTYRVDGVSSPANGMPFLVMKQLDDEVQKATWSTAFVNDLPDSSFAYIEPGGKKDDDGKTTPRSLRHFPYKDADGKVDLPHLRNALAQAPKSDFGPKAMPKLQAAARANGVGDDTKKSRADTAALVDRILGHVASKHAPAVDDIDLDAIPFEAPAAKDVVVPGMASMINPDATPPAGDLSGPQLTDDPIAAGAPTVTPPDAVTDSDGNLPGSPEWEAFDAALLTDAATGLAAIAANLQLAVRREGIEVATGDTADQYDVWCLQDAIDAVCCALGIVSRLSFTEGAEAAKQELVTPEVTGRLLAAQTVLNELVSSITIKAATQGDGEEVSDMDRDELVQLIDDRVTEGVTKALGSKKFAKRVAKALADAASPEPTAATAAVDAGAGATTDGVATEPVATDGDATKSTTEPVAGGGEANASDDTLDEIKGAVTELVGAVKSVNERVEAIAKTPMPGGPALNGAIPEPGSEPITRGQEDVAKSAQAAWDAEVAKAQAITDPVKKAEAMNELSRTRLSAFFSGADVTRLPIAAPSDDTAARAAGDVPNAAVSA